MEEMEDVLPLKLQARDELLSHVRLSREFKALTTIANKRKLKILVKESAAVNEELEKLQTEINQKNDAIVELMKTATGEQQKLEKRMKLYDLIQKERNDLRAKICQVNIKSLSLCPPKAALEHYKQVTSQHITSVNRMNELEALIVDVAKHLNEKCFKTKAKIKAIKWKTVLKRTRSEEELKMKLKMLSQELNSTKSSMSYFEEALEISNAEIDSLKAQLMEVVPLDVEGLNIAAKNHHDLQMVNHQAILNLNSQIFQSQRTILDINEEIAAVVAKGQEDMATIETLTKIEAFVMSNQELKLGYIGPVFNYLKDDEPVIDVKMWSQLKTVANIILFTRGSIARKVHRELVASGMNLGSYILLGFDEYVPSTLDSLEGDLAENIKSAELLVHPDGQFKNLLKLLLHDIMLVEHDDLSMEELPSFAKLIIYSSAGITTKTDKFITLQSSLPSYAQSQKISPILVLRNIYDNLKKREAEKNKIEHDLNVKRAMENLMQQQEEKYRADVNSLIKLHSESSSVVAFQQILTAFKQKADLENRFHLKIAEMEMLMEINENIQEKIKSWDIVELKMTMQEMQLQLSEQEKRSAEMKEDMELKKKQLEHSIEIMEHLKQLLSNSIGDMENPWDGLTESSIANKAALIELFQTQLNIYSNDLEKTRGNLLPKPVITNTQPNVDLLKIRCQFYEKNSERDVIVNAMKQCQRDIEGCKELNFDQSVYEEFRQESGERIREEINECMRKLQLLKQTSDVDVMTQDRYGHLFESIKKVARYVESPEQVPVFRNKIAARTYPVINKVIVKMLKDAVHNYRLAFNFVMANFIKDSTLFFYTYGLFDEIKENDFSWNCFDLSRLKAMNFVVNWKKGGKLKIGPTTLRMVKGLLLIMYIISYLSIFKFIIIDEKMFDVSR